MTSAQKQAIADEYFNNLTLDEGTRAKPQFCLCMIGLPGSGKSTILAELIKRIPMIRQSGDDVKVMLRERGLPIEYTPEIATIVSEKLKMNGYNVAHDNDFGRADIRELHASQNAEKGIRDVWIRIKPPEKYILDNLEKRQVAHFADAQEQLAMYYKRKELHESDAKAIDAIPYVYTFDPSRGNMPQQIDEAVNKIKASLQAV